MECWSFEKAFYVLGFGGWPAADFVVVVHLIQSKIHSTQGPLPHGAQIPNPKLTVK